MFEQRNYATEERECFATWSAIFIYVLCTDMMTGFMPVGYRAGYGIDQLRLPHRCNKCDTASMPGKSSCSKQINTWTQNHCYCVPNETRPSFFHFCTLYFYVIDTRDMKKYVPEENRHMHAMIIQVQQMSPYTTHVNGSSFLCSPRETDIDHESLALNLTQFFSLYLLFLLNETINSVLVLFGM